MSGPQAISASAFGAGWPDSFAAARLFVMIPDPLVDLSNHYYLSDGRTIRTRCVPRELPNSFVTTTCSVAFGTVPGSNVIACVPAPAAIAPSLANVQLYEAPRWSGTEAVTLRVPSATVKGAVMLASGASGGGGVVTCSEKSSMKK